MRGAVMQGASLSDVILPSFDEEAEHFGDATPLDAITRYLAAGANTVVVKDGARTVNYCHNGFTGQIQPDPAPTIVDTTSAGDSFNALLLVGMGQSTSIEGPISLACKVALQLIAQRGALVTLDIGSLELT